MVISGADRALKRLLDISYFDSNVGPYIFDKIKHVDLGVAVFSFEASVEHDVFGIHKACSVVRDLSDVLACGLDALPLDPLA